MTGVQQIRTSGVGVAVAALCLVQFVDVLGVMVVVTALPDMLASLHAPGSYASLIATGYAMFFGGLLMLGARESWALKTARAVLTGPCRSRPSGLRTNGPSLVGPPIARWPEIGDSGEVSPPARRLPGCGG
jgi:hypothetical protein